MKAEEGRWPAFASEVGDAIRLMSCTGSDGYVKWKQAGPDQPLMLALQGCDDPEPPRQCLLAMCLPLAGNIKLFAIDARFIKAIPGSNILSAGRHRYTVVEQTKGTPG
jgi:hypothetical protein